MRVAVLVEGESDAEAVRALAESRGVDLPSSGVLVVAMGGVTNLARHAAGLGPRGRGLRLTGLYDAGEERFVRGGLERAGLAIGPDRDGLAAVGFHCCDRDLEDELIRALGADAVEAVVDAHGDLGPFRTLQKQPEWRGRPKAEQLRRFLGSGGRRKIRYARYLVEALDLAAVPRPLDRALAHV